MIRRHLGAPAVLALFAVVVVVTPAHAQDDTPVAEPEILADGAGDLVPVPSDAAALSLWDAVAGGSGLQSTAVVESQPVQALVDLDGDTRRLLVKLRPGVSPATLDDVLPSATSASALFSRQPDAIDADRADAERLTGRVVPDLNRWLVVESVSDTDGDAAVDALVAADLAEVVAVDPDLAVTSTPDEDLQIYLNPAPSGVDAEWAWTQAGGSGANITIGVVDSGFDTSHPDLDRVRLQGVHLANQPARDTRHGMHVLGILAADDDSSGIRGILHDADVMTVNSGTKASHLANAVNLLSANMSPGDVISVSQGICAVSGCTDGVVLPLVYSSLAREALNVATGRGVITVVSAGNSSVNVGNYSSRLGGDSPDTIVVGAGNPPAMAACVDEDGPARGRVASSNYGSRVDLQGTGACVWTTAPSDTYTMWGFTSAATPVVSGAAGSLSSIAQHTRGIALTGDQVRRLLAATGSPQVTAGTRGGAIGPLPDIEAAVANLWLIPLNDMWAGARSFGALPYQSTLVSDWAGVQVDEPATLCGPIGHTVWYRFTPGVDMTVGFDTIGSDYDTMLGLWRRQGSSLAREACNDDRSPSSSQSRIVHTLEAGETYYVQVGGAGGASGNMVFNASMAVHDSSQCDVHGDGYADIVSGAPAEDIGADVDAGRIVMHAGNAAGSPTVVRAISRDSSGFDGGSADGDRMGAAVACGDFDADGRSDVAVGSPGEAVAGRAGAGAVRIVRGSTSGFSGSGRMTITQDSTGVEGVAETGDAFGAAVATGDFDNDGYDDLAVGVPGEGLGALGDAGVVQLFFGGPGGLDRARDRVLHQDTFGVDGVNEVGDGFGAVLAAGDVNGDGYDDLVVGAWAEDVGAAVDAGAVWFLPGSVFGVTGAGGRALTQRSNGVAGEAESGDHFGAALALGDFDGSGRADIAIGAPGEGLWGTNGAGVVHIIVGAAFPSGAGSTLWHQDVPGVAGAVESGDGFGRSLAAGDVHGDGRADLMIGVPGEALGPLAEAGGVHVLKGSAAGITASGDIWLHQDVPGVPGNAETGDGFGAAVAAADLTGDGRADVLVGVPGEGLGPVAGAGYITIIPGSSSGPVAASAGGVHQDAPPSGASEPGDGLGAVLAG